MTGSTEVLVYVGTYTDDPADGIYQLRLDTRTGALRPAGETLGMLNPFFLKVDAAGERLYAALAVDECDGEASGAVSAFAIDAATGDLTYLNRQLSCGTLPCYISLDRSGRNLLTGNYNSGSVAVLPIDAQGRLQPASAAVQHTGDSVHERQEGPHVHCLVLDPSERWAYAADLGADEVRVYDFDATAGTLSPGDPPAVTAHAPGAGPRHIAFHPNGAYAYLLNELDGTLTAYAFDADSGRLEVIHTESTLPAGFTELNYAADVQILPSGRFLYTTNRGHDSIAIFAVDAGTGRVERLGHEPAQGRWPWNLGIDPTASFLLSANYEGDNVVVFGIDGGTGALTPTGHQASVPKPVCIAMLGR